MPQKLENSSMNLPTRPSSPGSSVKLPSLKIKEPTHGAVLHVLPQTYGIPLLEILVVDTEFVFLSWEITQGQLDEAREQLGKEFGNRTLVVSLISDANTEVSRIELYGETGRWFHELHFPGLRVKARLCFETTNHAITLSETGFVAIPRDVPVEPDSWEELAVQYTLRDGRIVISGVNVSSMPEFPSAIARSASAGSINTAWLHGVSEDPSSNTGSWQGGLGKVDSESGVPDDD